MVQDRVIAAMADQ